MTKISMTKTEKIKSIIASLPTFKNKDVILRELTHIQEDNDKTYQKYVKANEDKLTLSHLLSKVNDELEDSLVNEKRFIASVSHELRTPLTAILGYSELLDDTALNNKQKRYLDSIIQSSNHLLSLITDLLDVAKLEDNRIELSPREVDLDDILNDCATLITSKINKDVDFFVDIPLLDYTIMADDKRVKQIFVNLLSNAAKFTSKGSIRYYVSALDELDNNKLRIVVNVDDTGNGVPKEVESTLFDPFQSTDKTQGTGLGLFISQQLAGMMDGEITVTSREGIGSSFKVSIIVQRGEKKEIGASLKGVNIMMFSHRDEFVNRLSKEFMHLGANFLNHDITTGDLTSSLVQMVVSGRFYDIGIFDLDIFNKYTNYIAGTLKAVNKDIKLVALAGKDNDESLAEFDKVINKPITHQRFIKETEEIFESEFFNTEEEVSYSDLRVLIVEDVELNREYEKEMLDNFFSISCDTAIHGAMAVEKVQQNEYDVVLMDMRMPVMDGLEATEKIRTFNKDLPIICMSANVYKEDKMAAEDAGMNDFIEKPLDKKDIETKLIKIINGDFKRYDDTEITSSQSFAPAINSETPEAKQESTSEELREIALSHLKSNFNDAIANKLFGKAVMSVTEYRDRVVTNFANKDIKELIEDFHALKGVLANIGLKELSDEAGDLQKLAEDGNFMLIIDPKEHLLKYINLFLTTS